MKNREKIEKKKHITAYNLPCSRGAQIHTVASAFTNKGDKGEKGENQGAVSDERRQFGSSVHCPVLVGTAAARPLQCGPVIRHVRGEFICGFNPSLPLHYIITEILHNQLTKAVLAAGPPAAAALSCPTKTDGRTGTNCSEVVMRTSSAIASIFSTWLTRRILVGW